MALSQVELRKIHFKVSFSAEVVEVEKYDTCFTFATGQVSCKSHDFNYIIFGKYFQQIREKKKI